MSICKKNPLHAFNVKYHYEYSTRVSNFDDKVLLSDSEDGPAQRVDGCHTP